VDPRAKRGAAILFGTAGGVFLVDRLSKVWAEHALADRPIDLLGGVLTLRFTTNSGGAFSLGQSAPWFFAGATLVVSALIVFTAFHERSILASIGLGLVLGGALGNLADRVLRGPGLRGHVVDFIDLHRWPVFNAADSAVVIGALLLAWSSFRDDRAEAARRRNGTPGDGA
jgi:signal peptidase II